MMKRFLSLLLLSVLVLGCFSACGSESERVLRVYNWQDYIDEGDDETPSVLDAWAEDYYARTGEKVRVQYDTFETNETMLNTLKTGKSQYDLVCPSDYVIQKMIAATENGTDDNLALEKFDYSKLENYTNYASPYIKQVFGENGFDGYAVGYMWGTVGIIYNPEYVDEEDTKSWEIMWNPKYQNRITLKDSVRDAYIPAMSAVYREQILALDGLGLSSAEYRKRLGDLMNSTASEDIDAAGEALKSMKDNIYGLEVDSGKTDIVAGKIHINQAWSGDAAYAIYEAEETAGVQLNFSVPEDGGSVWFDGWVMPKGADTELAHDLVNYLCAPEVAVRNMDYIGYTSIVAGDEVFDYVLESYSAEDGEHTVDLTYYFNGTLSEDYYSEDGKILVQTDEVGRMFSAQYPEESVALRGFIMRDFGNKNEEVLTMWAGFKSNNIAPEILIAIFSVIILGAVAVFLWFTKPKRDSARRRKEWLAKQK
ncbi:MAG: ABC transporter substrate-binding protein [Clostridia bacterium]|nr:ABC transporter substrate-binding protein [Clostridia bacterium]